VSCLRTEKRSCATRRSAKRKACGLAGRSLGKDKGLGLNRSDFGRSTSNAFCFFLSARPLSLQSAIELDQTGTFGIATRIAGKPAALGVEQRLVA
jgi:hypothetical protein